VILPRLDRKNGSSPAAANARQLKEATGKRAKGSVSVICPLRQGENLGASVGTLFRFVFPMRRV
jgi:hypothetical protein